MVKVECNNCGHENDFDRRNGGKCEVCGEHVDS